MIGRIKGKIIEKAPPLVLVDVGGVGYEVLVPMSTFCSLPEAGGEASFLTHFVVREDAMQLYGFSSAQERDVFRALIRISGIGPKIGLAVLSSMSISDFASAVESEDAAMISRTPGIGKKTAERIILELKGKLSGVEISLPGASAQQTSDYADVVGALTALGYSSKEAASAVKTLAPGLSVSDGIRKALQHLSK